MCFAWFLGSHNREYQCPVNELGCLDPEVCIHLTKLCDGVPDCTDGWDEGPHCRGNNTQKHAQTSANFCFLQNTVRTDSIIIFFLSSLRERERETRVAAFVVGEKWPASCSLLASPFLPIQKYNLYPIISFIGPFYWAGLLCLVHLQWNFSFWGKKPLIYQSAQLWGCFPNPCRNDENSAQMQLKKNPIKSSSIN